MSASFSDSEVLGVCILAFREVIREYTDLDHNEQKSLRHEFLKRAEKIFFEVEREAAKSKGLVGEALAVRRAESNIEKMKEELNDIADHGE